MNSAFNPLLLHSSSNCWKIKMVGEEEVTHRYMVGRGRVEGASVLVKEAFTQLSPGVKFFITGYFLNRESLLFSRGHISFRIVSLRLAQGRSPHSATCTVAGVWELYLEGWQWAAFLFIEPGS